MNTSHTPEGAPLLLDDQAVTAVRALPPGGFAAHVDAIAAAFLAHGQGQATLSPRTSLITDADPGAPRPRSFKVLSAAFPQLGFMGTATYPAGYGRPIDFRVQLCSARSGQLLGIVEGEPVTHWATGAVTAVATRALSRPDARMLALIGTGTYAFDQAVGICHVRPITEIRCHSRDAARRGAFVTRLRAALPDVGVREATSAAEALDGADIVTTVTTSHEPVFDGTLLRPGMHVNAVGMHYPQTREVDSATIQRARVLVDDIPQCMLEKGELLIPIAQGAIGPDHVLGSLGALLAGRVEGRRSPDDITLFGSSGTALEYLAVADLLLQAARQAGIGRALRHEPMGMKQ